MRKARKAAKKAAQLSALNPGKRSVVSQMAAVRGIETGEGAKSFAAPKGPVDPNDDEAIGQRKALKELLIKFEKQQKEIEIAQMALMNAQGSFLAGLSRTRIVLLGLTNNLALIFASFCAAMLYYSVYPDFDGGLATGGEVQAAGVELLSRVEPQQMRIQAATGAAGLFVASARTKDSPGGKCGVLGAPPGAQFRADCMATSVELRGGGVPHVEGFELAVPGVMAGSAMALVRESGGTEDGTKAKLTEELISWGEEVVRVGTKVGDKITVRNVLTIDDSSITTQGGNPIRIHPAIGQHLYVTPRGSGGVRSTARDLKVDGDLLVGPKLTFVNVGGMVSNAGKVPALGVQSLARVVTMGSIVDPIRFKHHGPSQVQGNITITEGDLNMNAGTLSLKNMQFGQVKSMSFLGNSYLGVNPNTDSATLSGQIRFVADATDALETVNIDATDGSISVAGRLNTGGERKCEGDPSAIPPVGEYLKYVCGDYTGKVDGSTSIGGSVQMGACGATSSCGKAKNGAGLITIAGPTFAHSVSVGGDFRVGRRQMLQSELRSELLRALLVKYNTPLSDSLSTALIMTNARSKLGEDNSVSVEATQGTYAEMVRIAKKMDIVTSAAAFPLRITGGMLLRSSTPGLYSRGTDPLFSVVADNMTLANVTHKVLAGGNVRARRNALLMDSVTVEDGTAIVHAGLAVHGRVNLTEGVQIRMRKGAKNATDTQCSVGSGACSENLSVRGAGSLTSIAGHLSATGSVSATGNLIVGLTERFHPIKRNATGYTIRANAARNLSRFPLPPAGEQQAMALATGQLAILDANALRGGTATLLTGLEVATGNAARISAMSQGKSYAYTDVNCTGYDSCKPAVLDLCLACDPAVEDGAAMWMCERGSAMHTMCFSVEANHSFIVDVHAMHAATRGSLTVGRDLGVGGAVTLAASANVSTPPIATPWIVVINETEVLKYNYTEVPQPGVEVKGKVNVETDLAVQFDVSSRTVCPPPLQLPNLTTAADKWLRVLDVKPKNGKVQAAEITEAWYAESISTEYKDALTAEMLKLGSSTMTLPQASAVLQRLLKVAWFVDTLGTNNTNTSLLPRPCNHSTTIRGGLSTKDLWVNITKGRGITYELLDAGLPNQTASAYPAPHSDPHVQAFKTRYELDIAGEFTLPRTVNYTGDLRQPYYLRHLLGTDRVGAMVRGTTTLGSGPSSTIEVRAGLRTLGAPSEYEAVALVAAEKAKRATTVKSRQAQLAASADGSLESISLQAQLSAALTKEALPLSEYAEYVRSEWVAATGRYQLMLSDSLEKFVVNPAADAVFAKDRLAVGGRTVLNASVTFGRLNVTLGTANFTREAYCHATATMLEANALLLRDDRKQCEDGGGLFDTDLRIAAAAGLCKPDLVWNEELRTRVTLCKGTANEQGTTWNNVSLFTHGANDSSPLYLAVTKPATLRSQLEAEQWVRFEGELVADKDVTVGVDLSTNGSKPLSVLGSANLGFNGKEVRVRGALVMDGGGYGVPFAISPLAGGSALIDGTMTVQKNSTLSRNVILGRAAENAINMLGKLEAKAALTVTADAVFRTNLASNSETLFNNKLTVKGNADFDVLAAPKGVDVIGYFIIQYDSISKFRVESFAKTVHTEGSINANKDVDVRGRISTGTLDASTLAVDKIFGKKANVGTTIEGTLLENGGFHTVEVDELAEQYLTIKDTDEGRQGVSVEATKMQAGRLFLATPAAVFSNTTNSTEATQLMSVTLATLTNSGHMAVMDGAITSMVFNQYYRDRRGAAFSTKIRTQGVAGSISAGTQKLTATLAAARKLGSQQCWTEDPRTQDAFLRVSTAYKGESQERLRFHANGDMEFGNARLSGSTGFKAYVTAASGDTVIRGDVTIAEVTGTEGDKQMALKSTGGAVTATVSGATSATLAFNALSGKEFKACSKGGALSVLGSTGDELLARLTNSDWTQASDSVNQRKNSLFFAAGAEFCGKDAASCSASVFSKDDATIEVTSRGKNDAAVEIKTGENMAAIVTLRDVGANPSTLNIILNGTAVYDSRPLLSFTDGERNHLMDVYDEGANAYAYLEGDATFGAVLTETDIALKISSQFEEALLSVRAGPADDASATLTAGYGRAAVLSLTTPFGAAKKPTSLRIMATEDKLKYRTLDWNDEYACTDAPKLDGNGDKVKDADGKDVVETTCGTNLMLSMRPNKDKVKMTSDLAVSGSFAFTSGCVKSATAFDNDRTIDPACRTEPCAKCTDTPLYAATVQSSDDMAVGEVKSAATDAKLVVTAGYLADAELVLQEANGTADMSVAAEAYKVASMQVSTHVDRTVQMLTRIKPGGNTTEQYEGPETLLDSWRVKNCGVLGHLRECHELLRLDLITETIAGTDEESAKMVIDGDVHFCSVADATPCAVSIETKSGAAVRVTSNSSTAAITITPDAKNRAVLSLRETIPSSHKHYDLASGATAINIDWWNDHAAGALVVKRTSNLTDPTNAKYRNHTDFFTLTNKNNKGELTVPGFAVFGVPESSDNRSCAVRVESVLEAGLRVQSSSTTALLLLSSERLAAISFSASKASSGKATYSMYVADPASANPKLSFASRFVEKGYGGPLLEMTSATTTHNLSYYEPINETYVEQLGDDPSKWSNLTKWRYYSRLNFSDVRESVGAVNISTDVTVGDVAIAMDHTLTLQSLQKAQLDVRSSGNASSLSVAAGNAKRAELRLLSSSKLTDALTGLTTLPAKHSLSLASRQRVVPKGEFGAPLEGKSYATLCVTDELGSSDAADKDSLPSDLLSLLDVAGAGYLTLAGAVTVGSADAKDHRVSVQSTLQASLKVTSAGADALLKVVGGDDIVDETTQPATVTSKRAVLHLRRGSDPKALTNGNGTDFVLAVGDKINGETAFVVESGQQQLLMLAPVKQGDGSLLNTTHKLSFVGSASFGGGKTEITAKELKADPSLKPQPLPCNFTLEAPGQASLEVSSAGTDSAKLMLQAGPAQKARVTFGNTLKGVSGHNGGAEGGSDFVMITQSVSKLARFELQGNGRTLLRLAATGKVGVGEKHTLDVTGTMTSMVALKVTNHVTLGVNPTDKLAIAGTFKQSELTILPNPKSELFIGFTLEFKNPTALRTITFDGLGGLGGTVLTRQSMNSTLRETGDLQSGSIAAGFGSISTANSINTTGTGKIISAGNFTSVGSLFTQQASYIGPNPTYASDSTVTYSSIVATGHFSEDVLINNGVNVSFESTKTTSELTVGGVKKNVATYKHSQLTANFDALSIASPVGQRDIAIPDYLHVAKKTLGAAQNGVGYTMAGVNALVLHRLVKKCDEVNGVYVDATTGEIESFATEIAAGGVQFIRMINVMLKTTSIVIATISEFGSGGVVMVHAVTVSDREGGCVITVRNIGSTKSVGLFKISFIIF